MRRLALFLAAAAPAHAAPLDEGWWVVVGVSPHHDFTASSYPEAERAAAAVKRCGLDPYGDFSGKFSGFREGFLVEVVGAYRTRRQAERVLARARRCVPGAYLRHCRYAGD